MCWRTVAHPQTPCQFKQFQPCSILTEWILACRIPASITLHGLFSDWASNCSRSGSANVFKGNKIRKVHFPPNAGKVRVARVLKSSQECQKNSRKPAEALLHIALPMDAAAQSQSCTYLKGTNFCLGQKWNLFRFSSHITVGAHWLTNHA